MRKWELLKPRKCVILYPKIFYFGVVEKYRLNIIKLVSRDEMSFDTFYLVR